MHQIKHIVFVILIFIAYKTQSQNLRVPGQVVDLKNNPIENVTVNIVGSNTVATTDALGVFSLIVPPSVKKGDILTIRIHKSGYNDVTKHIAASPLVITIKLSKNKTFKEPKINLSPPLTQPSEVNHQLITQSNSENNKHIVTGFGNTVGVNGDVNINQERHLTEVDKTNMMAFINSITVEKNIKNISCFQIGLINGSNGIKLAMEIEAYLKEKGYTMLNQGYSTVFPSKPILGVAISIQNNCLNIVIGAL